VTYEGASLHDVYYYRLFVRPRICELFHEALFIKMSLASGGHPVTEVTALPQRRQRLSEQVNISFGNLDFGGNI